MSEKYAMPRPCIGDPVVWYPDLSCRDESAAVITRVGPQAVSLSITPVSARGGIPKDGVRHLSDPDASKQFGNDGFWDFSESHTKQEQKIANLEARLARLEKELSS